MDIIHKALEYYDSQKIKYKNILSTIRYYKLIIKNADVERSIIIFYNKKKEEIFKSRYEYVGNYFTNGSIWTWAWGILYYHKNQNFLSRKILNYGLDIPYNDDENNKRNINQDIFLKHELITPRFLINNYIQLDIHLAICSYLTKIPLIIPVVFSKNETLTKFKYADMHNITQQNVAFLFLLDYDTILSK